METTTRKTVVIADRLPALREKITAYNRKAERFNQKPMVLTVGAYILQKISICIGRSAFGGEIMDTFEFPAYEVELSGEVPRINGWKFIAKLETVSGEMVGATIAKTSAMNPQELPKEFRGTVDLRRCDHCGVRAVRKAAFVISKDSEVKQVGSNCLADFCGTQSAEAMLHAAEWPRIVDEFEEIDAEYATSYRPDTFVVRDFLAFVAERVETKGWMPADSADSTAAWARESYMTMASHKAVKPEPKYFEQADAWVAWAQTVEADGDYLHNIKALCAQPCISKKHGNLLASVCRAYDRANRIAEEKAVEVKVLVVAGRRVIRATVISTKVIENNYGSQLKMLVRATDGQKLWGSVPASLTSGSTDSQGRFTPAPVLVGSTVEFTGTVEISDQDVFFGFFSRPSKAKFV